MQDVGIGDHDGAIRGRQPENAAETGELIATGLTVDLADGRRLLAAVDLVLEPGQLTAIVGPSGSGKSTLLNALSGIRPASSGVVLYNGQDLYGSFAELRHRIGHVPQDEVLHLNLPLRRALTYTAALRFGSHADANDRNARVTEVLDELGLTERSDITIDRLSGGQQQRASVGLELLTRPSMLFLDEPTSGLDPGYERSVTRLFRELADGGRTVVVVTHAVASLGLCDSVVFLAPGGKLAYVGEPQGALAWFAAADYPEVFLELEANGDGAVVLGLSRAGGIDAHGRHRVGVSTPVTGRVGGVGLAAGTLRVPVWRGAVPVDVATHRGKRAECRRVVARSDRWLCGGCGHRTASARSSPRSPLMRRVDG